MKPRHIHVIDAIYGLGQDGRPVTDEQAETAINAIMQLKKSMPKGGSAHE